MTENTNKTLLTKVNLLITLSIVSLLLSGVMFFLWQKDKKALNFLAGQELAIDKAEQIDPQHARTWGNKYNAELANNNTVAISFDFDDFMKVAWNYRGLVDQNTGYRCDQVYVKLIRYDDLVNTQYGRGADKVGRVSVCFYPYNKSSNTIVDDGTDDSKPLNLGDLHP